MRFEKSSAKGGFEACTLPSTSLELMLNERLDEPNHTLVGGVSVNSLCQRGMLFALSLNKHSGKIHMLKLI